MKFSNIDLRDLPKISWVTGQRSGQCFLGGSSHPHFEIVHSKYSQSLNDLSWFQTDYLLLTCSSMSTIFRPKQKKTNSADQPSCKSFSEQIHGYQLCKTFLYVVRSEKRSLYCEKSVKWPHPWLRFEWNGLNSWKENASKHTY